MGRPVKRSFTLKGHRTSISIEKPFWDALKEVAAREGLSLAGLVSQIDQARSADSGLSSAVRVWILLYYRRRCDASEHSDAGNGQQD